MLSRSIRDMSVCLTLQSNHSHKQALTSIDWHGQAGYNQMQVECNNSEDAVRRRQAASASNGAKIKHATNTQELSLNLKLKLKLKIELDRLKLELVAS